MKKSKKVISLMAASVLAMSVLAGCGKKTDTAPEVSTTPGESGTSTTSSAPKEDLACTLNTVSMKAGEDPNTENYLAVIDQFSKDFPHVTIEDNSATADTDWKIQIEADFSMENEPDVIEYFTDASATNILQMDKFVTLDEIRAEMPEIAQNTSPIALEQTKSPLDGKNYAVPTTGYWEGMYCNKDLFDKFNLELPTDWDKLTKAIKTFKENGITPIAVALNDVPNYWIEFLMMTASTQEEFVQIPETAPASWVEGLSKLKELYDLGAFSEDVLTIDNEIAGKQFKNKKAAMQLDGSWYLNGIPDTENTVVCAFPTWEGAKSAPNSAIAGYSSGFYITKKAWADPAKRAAALNFVYANTNDAQILEYWGGNGSSSVPVPEGGEFNPLQLSGAEFANTIVNQIPPTDARVSNEAFASLKDNVIKIATGKMSAEDAINQMLKIQNR